MLYWIQSKQKVGACAMMEFLYFPEDKSAYIPAVLTLIIFTVLAFMFFRWMNNISKREQQSIEERFPEEMNVQESKPSRQDS
ncbi:putative membrane protein [Alkalibacillus flavidus]|uniref:Membrane protein n=1 Tax=Alkalibacillus flavidus TaxID=546021 RepID=A0ABV2KVM4_9BACI